MGTGGTVAAGVEQAVRGGVSPLDVWRVRVRG